MKPVLIAAAAAAAALVALPAAAQDTWNWSNPSWYGTLGWAWHDADEASVSTIQGRVGARFHPNFGVEGELGFGIDDDSIAPGIDAKISDEEAIYAIGFLPINPNLDLFARVGWGRTGFDVDCHGPCGGGFDDDDSGVRFGGGAQWFWDGQNGVRGEYTREENDNTDADTWSISYVRKF
jgi:hypothetical protein